MANYALVDPQGVVENLVAWDGATEWQPSPGWQAIAIPDGVVVSIGYTYAAGVFTFGQTPAQIRAANQAAILAFLAAAMDTLATMQTQLATLLPASYADYGTANLANLQDLQHKLQAIANGPARDGNGGLNQLTLGLRRIIRILTNAFDATT